jgi:hypothetical protein
MDEKTTAVLGFIGGAFLPWILSLFKTKLQSDKSQFEILSSKYMELYEHIKASNEECEKKYKELMDELFDLKNELTTLKK